MIEQTRASAPGKLYIAGEYAVVEPGEPAVLVAVNRLLTVELHPRAGDGVTITSSAYSEPRQWRVGEAPTDYLTSALATVEALRADRGLPSGGYHLTITSDLEEGGRKFGLGSSGAVTVATVDAVARAHGLALTDAERFRLALVAALHISPKGSGGDIAASTYGGWLRYTSPDRSVIAEALARRGLSVAIADDAAWAGCTITRLPTPAARFLVGWTGEPASTDAQIERASGGQNYSEFFVDSRVAVDAVTTALRTADGEALMRGITAARGVLARFAHARGTTIETDPLAVLADTAQALGGAGKSSGAGGGDCGIAFVADERSVQLILEEWTAGGIIPLDLAAYQREGDTQ